MDLKYYLCLLSFGTLVITVNGIISVSLTVEEELSGNVSLGNIKSKVDTNESKLFSRDLTNVGFNILQDGDINYVRYFRIERNSDFFMVQKVDREDLCGQLALCKMNVRIFASNGTVSEFVYVSVTILDINDNKPKFSQNQLDLYIPEGTALGTSYTLPSATDLDSGKNGIQRYILEPNDTNYNLEVHTNLDGSSTLNLVLNLILDRELWDNYQLYVKAVDGGSPSYTGTLTVNINVTDKNDNSPIFDASEYNTTIDEDVDINSEVITVKAHDRDIGENGRVAYYFADSASSVVRMYFIIEENTGKIFVKHRLDSTSKPFVFFVDAKDFGDPVKRNQVKVTINVRDKNDNRPVIQTSPASDIKVRENVSIGTHVTLIIVTDADTGLNGEADCECLNTNFTIIKPVQAGVNTFSLITAVSFDRETLDTYSVEINCSDKGQPPLSSNTTLIVTIEDENDHTPVFSNTIYRANVTENNNINAVLLRVTATDLDIADIDNLFYQIQSSPVSDKFTIDPVTGIIKAAFSFDREKNDSYRFIVTAQDQKTNQHTASATVIITVLDQNDNSPKFIGDSYAMSVMENSEASFSLGTVTATDEDLGDNGRVSYMIPAEYATYPFGILDDGTVITTAKLDRELVSNYHFNVVASDHGISPRSTRIPVYVTVLDENDNAPVFEFPDGDNNTVSVPHNTKPNVIIASVIAEDADEKENKRLMYSIIGGDPDGLFGIDPDRGYIFLTKPFSSGDIKQFSLSLSVKDNGANPLESRATLFVRFYLADEGTTGALTGSTGQNILIAIVISCVTFVLSVIIITIICIIKRKDKKNSLYNAKAYDEQKIMDIHRNSNRSSSSRGSQDKMLVAGEKLYMENGYAKKPKKEVSFIIEEDNGISTETGGNYDHLSTFKAPSPVPSKSHDYENYDQEISPTRSEKSDDNKQREIHRMTSLRVHQALIQSQTNNNNKQWPQSPTNEEMGRTYIGSMKHPNLDDSHSESSGETTTSDSGRGGSEEDIRSNLTSSHDADESRSPNTSTSHPFYTSDSRQPTFSSFHGNSVHKTGPILSSFLKQKQKRQQSEDAHKAAYPMNDLSSPHRNNLYKNNPYRHSSEVNIPPPILGMNGGQGMGPVQGLQNQLDFHPEMHSSKQSNLNFGNSFENESVTNRSQDDDNTTTTSGSYTINDIQDDILTSEAKEMFYKPDTFV